MEKKWYQRSWFMWLMLVFLCPIGLLLMYMYSDYSSRTKKIIAAISIAFFVFAMTNKPPEKYYHNDSSTPIETKSDSNKKPNSVSKNNYFQLSEEQIEKSLGVPVVGMNLTDFWEMEHPDQGLADVKGSFDNEGKKHTFRARFIIDSKETVLLKIDDKDIFFNEEAQDKELDKHSSKK